MTMTLCLCEEISIVLKMYGEVHCSEITRCLGFSLKYFTEIRGEWCVDDASMSIRT